MKLDANWLMKTEYVVNGDSIRSMPFVYFLCPSMVDMTTTSWLGPDLSIVPQASAPVCTKRMDIYIHNSKLVNSQSTYID